MISNTKIFRNSAKLLLVAVLFRNSAKLLLVAVLLVGCKEGKEIPKVIKIKYYTSFSGDLIPNGICRFFYKEREYSSEYTETQEKCDCYQVGDTIR